MSGPDRVGEEIRRSIREVEAVAAFRDQLANLRPIDRPYDWNRDDPDDAA